MGEAVEDLLAGCQPNDVLARDTVLHIEERNSLNPFLDLNRHLVFKTRQRVPQLILVLATVDTDAGN